MTVNHVDFCFKHPTANDMHLFPKHNQTPCTVTHLSLRVDSLGRARLRSWLVVRFTNSCVNLTHTEKSKGKNGNKSYQYKQIMML